ncbi:MAG: cysteine desulfurase [Clostridia bacterium]|nr:cysteine desulfurase [Clostridia bacterium]
MVYFDNSATTKPCSKAIEYINEALTNNWANPSSLYDLGMNAEILVSKARQAIAKVISAREDEIIFTSSGTEANNTAVMAALYRKGIGKRIITTEIEHPSVLETVKRLEDEGFEVIRLKAQSDGTVSLSQLESCLDSKTVLVSIMMVNNEIGTIQPIKEAAKLIRKLSPRAYFHCDAVQAFGKVSINVKDLDVDMLTASAHKIHGPKGVGFLYCKKGVAIKPFITGGGQEKGLRSGTESVPLIAGFLGAVESLPDLKKQQAQLREIKEYAISKFKECEKIIINSPCRSVPFILNISVMGYRSETLLHFLESKQIYVSSGSACAKGEQSYVLSALGFDKKRTDSALRLSFSRYTEKEEIDLCLSALVEAVKRLRPSNI